MADHSQLPNATPGKRPSDASSSSAASTASKSRSYTGPTVRDMIANHTVAENIIKYHSHATSGPVLDSHNLDLLRRFVNSSSGKEREAIMKEADFEGQVDDVTGVYEGTLSGYLILRSRGEVGESVEPVLTNEEIDTLKRWFEGGMKGGPAEDDEPVPVTQKDIPAE